MKMKTIINTIVYSIILTFLAYTLPYSVFPQVPTSTPGVTLAPSPPTYYVDGGAGEDGYNGLSPNWTSGSDGPWQTISHAVDQLDAGDICRVRAGTYREQVDAGAHQGTIDGPIVLEGDMEGAIWPDSLSRPVIDAENSRQYCFRTNKSYWVFKNFETRDATIRNVQLWQTNIGSRVINVHSHGSSRAGIYCEYGATESLIRDCSIFDNREGIRIYGLSSSPASAIVDRCRIYNNSSSGIEGSIYGDAGSSLDVRSSLIYENHDGIDGDWLALTVSNCTVASNSEDGIRTDQTITTGTISNSVITGNAAGIREDSVGLTTDYNDLWDNAVDWSGGGSAGFHSIILDPEYLNSSTDDYHLAYISPCRGAGNRAWCPATDLDQNSFSIPPSMGCYEAAWMPTPTISPSPTPSPTPTPEGFNTPIITPTPSPTASPSPSLTPSPTPEGYIPPANKVAVLISSDDLIHLGDEINTYVSDVEARFYVDLSIHGGNWTEASEVRQTLNNLYAGGGISGAILVGQLPYALFPYGMYHTLPRAIPVFYEDLDGEFLDIGHISGTTAGDGVYDYYHPHEPDPLEIWVTFIRPQNNDPDYMSTLRNFFDRTHEYYLGNSLYPRRGLIFSHPTYPGFANPGSALRNSLLRIYGDDLMIEGGNLRYPYKWDYLRRLREGYQYIYPASHGGGSSHQGIYTWDVEGMTPPRSLITTAWACSNAQFHNCDDNIAIGYVMGNSDGPTYSDGQAFIGASETIGIDAFHVFTNELAEEGITMGEAYFTWLEYLYGEGRIRWSEWDQTYFPYDFAFIGNPFLKVQDIRIERLSLFFVYADYGDTDLTINGANFSPAATVRFNQTAGTVLSAVCHRITARIPAGLPAGVYHITVTNPGGESVTWTDTFYVITTGDSDSDGLSDLAEVTIHLTDPFSDDTDQDGITDDDEISGAENIHYGYRPTDPCDPDSDEDGLTDWEEINGELIEAGGCGSNFPYSDPTDFDTDNDGWTDSKEVTDGVLCRDPTIPDPDAPSNPPYSSDRDTDSDGITDESENYYYKTSPAAGDSDEDGLDDGDEVAYWKTHIPPLDPAGDLDHDKQRNIVDSDSDNDDIADGVEVTVFGTDAGNEDSDFDGLPDGWEIYYGLNPLVDDAAADPDEDGLTNLEEYLVCTDPAPPPPPSEPHLYYVDGANGHDNFDGRYPQPVGSGGPWKTISHAVKRLSAGDLCRVRAGTYREQVEAGVYEGTSDNPVLLQGDCTGAVWPDSLSRPVIDAENIRQYGFMINKSYWILKNFEVKNATIRNVQLWKTITGSRVINVYSHHAGRSGIYCEYGATESVISDCLVHDNQYGIRIYGLSDKPASATVRRCRIYDNIEAGIEGSFYQVAGSSVTVEASLIYGNNAGIDGDWQALTAHNCTAVGNAGDGIRTDQGGTTGNIANCVVTGNTTGIWANSTGLTTDFNDLWDNTTNRGGGGVMGAHSISLDPDYQDPASDDYHLPETSPCRQVGSGDWNPSTDLDGNLFSSPPSLGCYEIPAPSATPTPNPSPTPTPSVSPPPIPSMTPTQTPPPVSPTPLVTSTPSLSSTPTPGITPAPSIIPTATPSLSPTITPSPVVTPTRGPIAYPGKILLESGDYNGDGTADIAIYRSSNGLWVVRGITRVYFGAVGDIPASGDYDADGSSEVAIFRSSSGLWAIRGLTRVYYGGERDLPIPGDYNGDGVTDIGIFRESSGLWAVRRLTRTYYGRTGDWPVPGYYENGLGKYIAVFRPSSGLWAIKNFSRFYFGKNNDWPLAGDGDGDGIWEVGIFRPCNGLWSWRNLTRIYFGTSNDWPCPADFNGDFTDDIAIFHEGLWRVRGITRIYYGTNEDIPTTR